MNSNDPVKFFVSCPPGLEKVLAIECTSLNLVHKTSIQKNSEIQKTVSGEEVGGFEFEGTLENVFKVNLNSRVASRVVVRLGEFYAAAFSELAKKASKLEWGRYLKPGQQVNLRAVCHKSKLYHSDAVIQRVLNAINLHFSSPTKSVLPVTQSDEGQMVLIRIVNDICTISIDSSGEHLYKRGYKQAVTKAPLRENLAAAMILYSGWDLTTPLIDPFCGSGTIPIEAAMIANKIPPGITRVFRFTDWPGFDKKLWESMLETAKKEIVNSNSAISGYDRDAGAIEIAQANAARAGQKNNIKFTQQAVSYLESPSLAGTIVTNPPYGIRTKENHDLRNLYSRFGTILTEKFSGWSLVILSSDDRLTGNLGLGKPTDILQFLNGGIPVKLLKFML